MIYFLLTRVPILMAILTGSGILTSILVLYPNYKYYKKIYKTLPDKIFYLNGSQVYSHSWGGKDDGFVYFLNLGAFRLDHGVFIHDAFFTYLDPYSFYWLIKYNRWFKKNVDIETIAKY